VIAFGWAITYPAATPEPDVRLSPHPAHLTRLGDLPDVRRYPPTPAGKRSCVAAGFFVWPVDVLTYVVSCCIL